MLLPRRRLFLLFPALCRLALTRVVVFSLNSYSDTRLAVLRLLMISPIWVMWAEDLNTCQMSDDKPEPEFINILTSIESRLNAGKLNLFA
jgi:hypothetical protein